MDEHANEEVDPRVKDQLEYLNSYTDEINSLELQLDEANATFRNTLSEYSQILKQLAKKLGKCVQNARPYFEAEEAAQKAKLECEESAIRYHRACGIHKEARDTIALTEEKFSAKDDEYEFSSAWQEMLNRETKKLINAEALKAKSEKEHQSTTQIFAEAVQKVRTLEQKLKKDIAKARIYFEQKKVFLKVLQDLKSRVESLQKAVLDSKTAYANCLRNLEMISKEIHDRRKLQLPPREPGVGAEGEFPLTDLSIYAPLPDANFNDTESDRAESLSSTENEISEDLKQCANFLKSKTASVTPVVRVKPRTRSEPCFPSSNLLQSLEDANCLDSEVLDKCKVSSSPQKSKQEAVPSSSSSENIPDPNGFIEVDLSGD